MTGVEDLAAMACSIEESIRCGDLGRAREEAARLPRAANQADRALSDFLLASA